MKKILKLITTTIATFAFVLAFIGVAHAAPPTVTVTGGEPLERMGYLDVTIHSNGSTVTGFHAYGLEGCYAECSPQSDGSYRVHYEIPDSQSELKFACFAYYKVGPNDMVEGTTAEYTFGAVPAPQVGDLEARRRRAQEERLAEEEGAGGSGTVTAYGDPEGLVDVLNPTTGVGAVVFDFAKVMAAILTFVSVIMIGINIIMARHKVDERTNAMTGFTYVIIGIIILDVVLILYTLIGSLVGDPESEVGELSASEVITCEMNNKI